MKSRENGQTIIAIIFVMVFSLAVGLSLSNRFIANLRSATQSDSSYRALAIAEAAVERILLIPNETLEEYIQFGSCGSNCHLEKTTSDGITAVADITLSVLGDSPGPLLIPLSESETYELRFIGYPDDTDISVCWNNPAGGEVPSIFALYLFGQSGSYATESYAYNSLGSVHIDNGFLDAVAELGYANCFTVSGKQDPVLLRLRSIYNDVDINILSTGGADIPSQGIKIESIGVVSTSQRKVIVIKGPPFVPVSFDYVLYQKSTTDPLSN